MQKALCSGSFFFFFGCWSQKEPLEEGVCVVEVEVTISEMKVPASVTKRNDH